MSRNIKVIILSAGQGRRLSPLTDDRPKCLIELSGRTVLHWQLAHLHAAGVREVVVVTGFGADMVDREVADLNLPGMQVRTLFNPFYAVSDNLATCWLARQEMDGEVMILNGDTLFAPAIAVRLLAAPEAAVTVTIDRTPSYDDDDMKVLTDQTGVLLAIGKTIAEFNAESIGFLRFSPEGAKLFVTYVEKAVRETGGLKRWYLSVIDQIARETGRVRVQSIEGLDWAEMDFPFDVVRNRQLTETWTKPSS